MDMSREGLNQEELQDEVSHQYLLHQSQWPPQVVQEQQAPFQQMAVRNFALPSAGTHAVPMQAVVNQRPVGGGYGDLTNLAPPTTQEPKPFSVPRPSIMAANPDIFAMASVTGDEMARERAVILEYEKAIERKNEYILNWREEITELEQDFVLEDDWLPPDLDYAIEILDPFYTCQCTNCNPIAVGNGVERFKCCIHQDMYFDSERDPGTQNPILRLCPVCMFYTNRRSTVYGDNRELFPVAHGPILTQRSTVHFVYRY